MFLFIIFLLLYIEQIQGQPGLAACGHGYDHYPFCNMSLSIDDRVHDLITRIQDSDKPGLLTARGNKGLPDLGIPSYYWGSNCRHSSMFANCTEDGHCSTSFPSGPNSAASFDLSLNQAIANVIGRETRAGWNEGNWTDNGLNGAGLDCWGPDLNINRYPRYISHAHTHPLSLSLSLARALFL